MVKPLVIGAQVSQRAVRAVSAVPGLDRALARGVVVSGRAVHPPVQAAMRGGQSALGSFYERAATVLFQANRAGAQALLQKTRLESLDADQLERLAVRYFKLKDYSTALTMRRKAAELQPNNALRWVALARSLRRGGDDAVVHDTVAGLTRGTRAHTEQARQALLTAQELEPDNAYLLHERGRLEFSHGDSDTGLELMRQAVEMQPRAQWLTELASAYRKPHIADLDRSLDAYERGLQLKPTSPTAFRGVVVMGCRADQDWPRMWRSAELFESAKPPRRAARMQLMEWLRPLFTAEPPRADVSAALVNIQYAQAKGLRLSFPTTSLIVYRLQFAQRMKPAFAMRRGLAERSLDWLGTSSAEHSRHRQKVLAALTYLQRYEQAQALIDPMPWQPHNDLERHRLEKMAADVHLIQGRMQPLVDYAVRRAQDTPMHGEERMARLLRGKRVAVVGPADTGDRLGADIDDYDVIIRPRLMTQFDDEQAARLGTRTDIAYFSGRDIAAFMEEASAAVDAGQLQMVVGRGLSIDAFEGQMPEWLRFYRHDFSLGFHGPPMGIGRILYDVMQFEPAEVGLFNIDFFSGQTAFSKGYREAKDQGPGPYSIVNEIVLAHDLAFEHRLTKAMTSTGVLHAKGVAAQVLALSEAQYIEKLETSPALKTTPAQKTTTDAAEDDGD
ncbi:hypothetical protein [Garicola koreensis]|uniref:Tetratricopeptide (TPR) repeat protein n=1 Tax=Garicola koreensis TaxID=1262554 RepID=A0A7W5Y0X1_9MICC|nr:hypothetical protein [Garicola koreensis]MBB3667628.1 tetratricopeptide (TPR) repeat protein [Garicola koreensis]